MGLESERGGKQFVYSLGELDCDGVVQEGVCLMHRYLDVSNEL